MSKKVSYIITDHNITVNYDGQTHIVPRKDSLSARLIDAIKNKKLDEIPKLVSVAKRVEEFGQGNFTIVNGKLFIKGMEVPEVLSRKVISFLNEGLPVEPLIKFADNLLKNPSYRSVNELFQFLEKNDHPLTDNGCFIAYKKVREDFKDVHSGKFDNSPGKVVEIPRNQVDEDSNRTCSHGLHVANWDYANNFYSGGVMLEVEVNPADVVAIPTDYDQAKMRVCRYVVLGVVDQEHSSDTVYRSTKQPSSCPVNEVDDTGVCDDCGNTCDASYDLCDDCYEEKCRQDEEVECIQCGKVTDSSEDDLCWLCKEEQEDQEEDLKDCLCSGTTDNSHQDEDSYPWESELD